VIATEGFHTFYDAQASALATAAGRRRQRRRRAHEKNQRKCVMSGVEGALSTRTPRPRWPPPQGGHPAAGRPHVAAAGRPQAVAAGRPQGGRRRTATAGRPQAATAGRPQAAAVRAAAGRAWATRIACLLRVGDENSMLAAERRDRESAEFGEMKREAGGLGEFLLCPQGKANKKKLTGWPQAAAGHRNPALGLSPPYF